MGQSGLKWFRVAQNGETVQDDRDVKQWSKKQFPSTTLKILLKTFLGHPVHHPYHQNIIINRISPILNMSFLWAGGGRGEREGGGREGGNQHDQHDLDDFHVDDQHDLDEFHVDDQHDLDDFHGDDQHDLDDYHVDDQVDGD